MTISFSTQGWEDYQYWISQKSPLVEKINTLIKDISRNGNMKGIGKPEPLKGDLSGYFSRRIDDANRLVYISNKSGLIILQCRYHYSK